MSKAVTEWQRVNKGEILENQSYSLWEIHGANSPLTTSITIKEKASSYA
jgi:hypothetical protein